MFCGAGGLSRGFHELGFRPRFANDIWDLALRNFLWNFDKKYAAGTSNGTGEILPLSGSVEDIDPADILTRLPRIEGCSALGVGDLDVLLGGPPCQGYSVNSHTRSATDPRNTLFKHYVRILHGLSPKVFVLENVPGMFSLDGGRFLDEFFASIGSSKKSKYGGYEIDFRILNAAHYGVPQERFRVVVVGTRRDVADISGTVKLPPPAHYSLARAHFKGGRSHTFHYAIGHNSIAGVATLPLIGASLRPPISVENAIGDLPPLSNGGGVDDGVSYRLSAKQANLSEFQRRMRRGAKILRNHWCRALLPPNTERVCHIPEGGDWRSIPHELLPPGMQRALRKDHTTRYGRLSRNQLSGTLLTKPDPHWGTFIHFDIEQQRLISVREAARLQSFPDSHVFLGGQVDQYRLCGNAVPPLMAEAVASKVKEVLDSYSESVVPKRRRAPISLGVGA